MTVDLHNEEGRQVVRQLAARSDVLLENFRPGVMEKWQVGSFLVFVVLAVGLCRACCVRCGLAVWRASCAGGLPSL
jgi:hypothetical protein